MIIVIFHYGGDKLRIFKNVLTILVILNLGFFSGCKKNDDALSESLSDVDNFKDATTSAMEASKINESSYTVNNFYNANISVKEDSITTESISVEITYTGDDTGNLGEWFILEANKNDKWYALPILMSNYDFNDIAYPIENDGSRTMDYNWKDLYGTLPSGEYRIIIKINNYRAPGNFTTYYLAVPFTIY